MVILTHAKFLLLLVDWNIYKFDFKCFTSWLCKSVENWGTITICTQSPTLSELSAAEVTIRGSDGRQFIPDTAL